MADFNDIPGYRYDPVRKRYFRIVNDATLQPLPLSHCRKRNINGHRTVGTHTQGKSAAVKKHPTCVRPAKLNFSWKTALVLRQMGQTTEHQFETIAKRNALTSSTLHEKKFSIVRHYVGYQLRGHSCLFLTTGNDSEHVVGIWKNRNGNSQWAHTFTFDPSCTHRRSRDVWVNDFIPLTVSLQRFQFPGQITSCCWADNQHSASVIVGVTNTPPKQSYGVQFLMAGGSSVVANETVGRQESLGNDAVFCCAFSEPRQMMAFGLECSGFIVDKSNQKRYHLPKVQDSFTSMSFSEDGQMLLSGSRKGILYHTDFRCRPSQQYSSKIPISAPGLCGLHLMRNQGQVVVSGFSNNLLLVDLRMTKAPVIRYEEHQNEYRKIPITVNEDLGVLCSVGQDKATRLWDINSPIPIKCHNPPATLFQDDEIPVATFQTGWRGKFNAPALFIAYLNSIFMYHI